MMPAQLLAEMAIGERRAVGLFRCVSQSELLTAGLRKWAGKIARDEAGHARIEEYWLSKADGYTPLTLNEYLVYGRTATLPTEPNTDMAIEALAWLWRAERDAAKYLPQWRMVVRDESPALAEDLETIIREEADHLRFHKSVCTHLQENHPRDWAYLQQLRSELLRRWPKIPLLSDVPVRGA